MFSPPLSDQFSGTGLPYNNRFSPWHTSRISPLYLSSSENINKLLLSINIVSRCTLRYHCYLDQQMLSQFISQQEFHLQDKSCIPLPLRVTSHTMHIKWCPLYHVTCTQDIISVCISSYTSVKKYKRGLGQNTIK